MINLEQNPSLYEVLATFCMTRGYIEFDYARLPECKAKVNPNAPSRVKADNSTVSIAPPEKVKAFIDDAPRMTKDGNFILTVRNINRRDAGFEVDKDTGEIIGESYFADKSNAQRDGTTKEGFVKGEYLYRSYRLDVRCDGKGIALNTVQVNSGGKKRLFPNVEPIPEYFYNPPADEQVIAPVVPI
jgi:hypothetical protein